MTIQYPDAADSIESLLDGVHGAVSEDWNELAGGVENVLALFGQLGANWANRPHAQDIVKDLVRIDAGIASAASSSWNAGVGITFDTGVFTDSTKIAVVAKRIARVGDPFNETEDNPNEPTEFGVLVSSTTSATIAGLRASGANPTGSNTVAVAWFAFQQRPAKAAGTATLLSFDAFPVETTGFDAAEEELPNAIAGRIEAVGVALGPGTLAPGWTSLSKALDEVERAVTGLVTASGNAFGVNVPTGVAGVEVTVDATYFSSLSEIGVECFLWSENAIDPNPGGNNLPIQFVAFQFSGQFATPPKTVTFKIRGYRHDGGAVSGTNQVTVGYCVRANVPAPS